MWIVCPLQGHGVMSTVHAQREAAAVTVQAAWRAFTVRAELRCQHMAATLIQVTYYAHVIMTGHYRIC